MLTPAERIFQDDAGYFSEIYAIFNPMKKIVVFTGAGVSADSGLATFRDSNGLWANYRIEDVCTPEALRDNRAQVVDFLQHARPRDAREGAECGPSCYCGPGEVLDVEVITQNVDNLHERAGSSRVTHLHGELTKLRSSRDPELIVPIDGWEQRLDATARTAPCFALISSFSARRL